MILRGGLSAGLLSPVLAVGLFLPGRAVRTFGMMQQSTRAYRNLCLLSRYCQCQRRQYSAATESSTIKVQHHPAPHSGTIRVLLLDRPEARNALSRKLVSELTRHVDEIQAEGGLGKTRALIIASNIDPAFCSGADLKERRTFTEAEYELARLKWNSYLQLPAPRRSSRAFGRRSQIYQTYQYQQSQPSRLWHWEADLS